MRIKSNRTHFKSKALMNSPKSHSLVSCWLHTCSRVVRSCKNRCLWFALAASFTGHAQLVEVTDNFNDGQDTTPPPRWVHYDPGTTGGQVYSWSFPTNSPG